MATILRSVRYIRSSGAFARHLVLKQKRNIIISVIRYDSAALSVSVDDRTPNFYSNMSPKKATSHFITKMEKMRLDLERRGWIWKEEIVQVINDIENNGNLNMYSICSLISWCGEHVVEISPPERIKLVLELWDTLNVYNLPMDISHYNALIKVYKANNCTFTPTTLLTEMRSKNIKPNIITYETIIEYYCKRGDIPNVKKILELMKEEGLSITESILNSLILGHSEAGILKYIQLHKQLYRAIVQGVKETTVKLQAYVVFIEMFIYNHTVLYLLCLDLQQLQYYKHDLESSVNILKIMKSNNITLTIDTYTALMCAYAKVNDVDTIEDIISVCRSKQLQPSNEYIWKVIYTLAANDHLNYDNKMFYHLRKVGYHSLEIIRILKLMEIGSTDVALHRFEKVLHTTVSNTTLCDHFVNLLVKKLVWSDTDSNKIVEVCTRFSENNFGWKNLQKAVYNSYFKNDESLTLTLLRSCRDANYTIRQHYFWPLLVWKGTKHDFQGILDILSCMVTEFKLAPNIDTVKGYVLPYAFGNAADVVKLLINHQVNEIVVHNAFVYHLLSLNKTRNAVTHMTRYPSSYYYEILENPLRISLGQTLDVTSFIQISKGLCKRNESNSDVNNDTLATSKSMMSMDEQLMDFIHYYPKLTYILPKVAAHLLETGIPISRATVDAITQTIGCDHMKEIANNGIYELQQRRIPDSNHIAREKYLDELLRRINAQKYRGRLTTNVESKLMAELCDTMDNQSVPFSQQLYSFAISYACKHNDLKHAEKFMELAKSTYRNFGTSALHLEYASLLAKTVKYDDVYQYVLQNVGSPVTTVRRKTHLYAIHLLKTLRDVPSFNFYQFKEMFNVLKLKNCLTISSEDVSELVQHYINKGTLAKPVDIFCLLLKEIKNPEKVQEKISKTLIMSGEHELLQQVINEISKYQNDTVVVSNLFFSLLECNQFEQAQNIFEMYKLHNHIGLWSNKITQYERNHDFKNLENFLLVSNCLLPIQRRNIYDTLIHIYVMKNEPQRGLNAWTRMHEENLKPSESALCKLGNLLKTNNQDIPFAYDGMKTSNTAIENKKNESIVEEVKEALRNEDLQKLENC